MSQRTLLTSANSSRLVHRRVWATVLAITSLGEVAAEDDQQSGPGEEQPEAWEKKTA